jgi:tungstate transport system substrate-binding protein
MSGAIVGCNRTLPKSAAPAPHAAVDRSTVRLASVPTAVEGGLLPPLLVDFEEATRLKVSLTVATKEVYDLARAGCCDLVVSHYGHEHAEAFVQEGWGEWPRTICSNQGAIFGPTDDPAGIRGMTSAVEAFRRIAGVRVPFIVNNLDGQRYVANVLWHSAGAPARESWWIDAGESRADALDLAAEKRAYALWGLTPFARAKKERGWALEPLVYGDPLLQRLMVTIIVQREKVTTVNTEGARALQNFLLEPSTQAKMRSITYPGLSQSSWAPAGRNNRTAILPHG